MSYAGRFRGVFLGAHSVDTGMRYWGLARWKQELAAIRALARNYRYWLPHYRAVAEALDVVEGELDTEMLRRESVLCREAFGRLEPAYAKFLMSIHPVHRPGHQPWAWKRTFHAAWERERALAAAQAASPRRRGV